MVSKHRSHALLCRAALLPCRFAGIARLAGKQLEPYVAQMVPKLYRLQVTMPVPFEQLCRWTGVTCHYSQLPLTIPGHVEQSSEVAWLSL